METITACENICRDFGWMRGFGQLVRDFGPAIALVSAVWLFFLKQKSERKAEIQRDRTKLYREFIAHIELVDSLKRQDEWYDLPLVRRLFTLVAEIDLIGTKEVRDKSFGVFSAIIARFQQDSQFVRQGEGRELTHYENIRKMRKQLVDVMRDELNS